MPPSFHSLDDEGVALYGVEAAGDGVDTPRHAASIERGTPGILHGANTFVLQDEDGQTVESHSISAGLDYPGVGPEHAWLADIGRAHYIPATDTEAMDAFRLLCRLEGIIPAIESAHAVAGAIKLAAELGPDWASRFTCSSTAWMLTGSRSTGRVCRTGCCRWGRWRSGVEPTTTARRDPRSRARGEPLPTPDDGEDEAEVEPVYGRTYLPRKFKTAFALPEGGVSQPVQGRFGTVLLRVTKIEAGTVKPFEAVEGEIRKALALARARDAGITVTFKDYRCPDRHSRIRNYDPFSPERARRNLANSREK